MNTTSISLIIIISYEIPEQIAVRLTTSHHRQVPKASRVVDVSIVVAAVAFSKTWQIYCNLDIVLEHLGFCVSGEEKIWTSIYTISPCVM